ncbi:MAG: peptide deformylase [Pirellulales bacterium]|jgi:peptide deformylase
MSDASGNAQTREPDLATIGQLELVEFPHPALRRVSRPLVRIDDELRDAVRQMFEIMYAEEGVGLAANQVALPYRLFIVNTEGRPNAGEELVFINPQLSKPRGTAVQQEGCLSLPGLRMDVRRPERVRVTAYSLSGEMLNADIDGFLARVVQHEFDHIEGRLFTDRLSEASVIEASRTLDGFREIFAGKQSRGELPADQQIVARLDALERARCQA